MRAFVSIDLPPEETAILAALQERLPFGRRADPDTFHVTLAFLGEDVAEEAVETLHEELIALRLPDFPLEVQGVSTLGAPAVLMADVIASDPLVTLHARVASACRRAGITLDRRRFRPHVTLARFRRDLSAHDLDRLTRFLESEARFRLDPFNAGSFALWQSMLTHDGPVHEELARYPLAR
ncbi:RNA 2',3'-cyclic phosphodiesterase [Pelagovum pacificum]|uniref:RNA 2',3'-cyclic phosphodiesterase n=1 Tax=Pelagovum pacificum TaxID=2588711 RepID=UPI0018CEC68B|nr:RNA 2',3'-cyclic phosphodiesterase [Pelagovum pacificum]QQA44602.1 RNA 2',3'-cyclic phosphodiesterase [Pelagovum pacificum]